MTGKWLIFSGKKGERPQEVAALTPAVNAFELVIKREDFDFFVVSDWLTSEKVGWDAYYLSAFTRLDKATGEREHKLTWHRVAARTEGAVQVGS